jgi:hypothetical protein
LKGGVKLNLFLFEYLMQPAIITSLTVDNPEIITIYLADERSISVPVRYFADIENLSLEERRR